MPRSWAPSRPNHVGRFAASAWIHGRAPIQSAAETRVPIGMVGFAVGPRDDANVQGEDCWHYAVAMLGGVQVSRDTRAAMSTFTKALTDRDRIDKQIDALYEEIGRLTKKRKTATWKVIAEAKKLRLPLPRGAPIDCATEACRRLRGLGITTVDQLQWALSLRRDFLHYAIKADSFYCYDDAEDVASALGLTTPSPPAPSRSAVVAAERKR